MARETTFVRTLNGMVTHLAISLTFIGELLVMILKKEDIHTWKNELYIKTKNQSVLKLPISKEQHVNS